MNQFLLAFGFYLVFSLFAGLGWFLLLQIFPKNHLLTYFVAKPLGLSIFGLVVWLAASTHLIDYQNTKLILGVWIVLIVLGLWFALEKIITDTDISQKKALIKNLIILELVSLALYFGYLYLRSFNAAAFGTERFMDMALLNSSLKASHFPFVDPWYAGKTINYYYYGHYLVSVLTKLSGISSFLTYNFALGWLYTTSFLLSVMLVYEITRSKFFSALAGFLVTTAGTMFYGMCVINSWLSGQPVCSYATSTRLFTPSYIINEIPSYSFTVGDLHAHFLALPFFIVNLILFYALTQSQKITKSLAAALLVAFVTSLLVNPSDAVSLALLLGLIFVYKFYQSFRKEKTLPKALLSPGFKPWIILGIFLVTGSVILYLPFLLNFKSPVLGFGLAPLFALKHNFWFNGHQYPTPLSDFLGMWGLFLLISGSVVYYYRKQFNEFLFPAAMLVAAIGLIILPELLFVKDIYHITNPPYFRANTVFKFGYHTWILLCLAFSISLAAIFQNLSGYFKRTEKKVFQILLGLFIFVSLIYPYQASQQFYLNTTTPRTLDASAFIPTQSSGDLPTVNFINQNIKTRSVILEAVGDSYTYFGRMSVFTGNISPMGWKTHEWTWRFDGVKAAEIIEKNPNATVETGYGPIAVVAQDVSDIYQSSNIDLTKQLINKYGVEYVYVGGLETATYPNLDEKKFYQLGKIIFEQGPTKLFKLD